jgi:hypothetical protein
MPNINRAEEAIGTHSDLMRAFISNWRAVM